MNNKIERECVNRLLAEIGTTDFTLESLDPPAPDVRVVWANDRAEVFEVTEVHPDEMPGRGSAARAEEERRAMRDPLEIAFTWIQTDSMPAIAHRVNEKVNKASNYAVAPSESLSLLLVGALAKPGAAAATFIASQFLNADILNRDLHVLLQNSRFELAYLHLQLCHVLWKWSRPEGWHILRQPPPDTAGLQTLEMLKTRNAGSVIPPCTHIVGRWL